MAQQTSPSRTASFPGPSSDLQNRAERGDAFSPSKNKEAKCSFFVNCIGPHYYAFYIDPSIGAVGNPAQLGTLCSNSKSLWGRIEGLAPALYKIRDEKRN